MRWFEGIRPRYIGRHDPEAFVYSGVLDDMFDDDPDFGTLAVYIYKAGVIVTREGVEVPQP